MALKRILQFGILVFSTIIMGLLPCVFFPIADEHVVRHLALLDCILAGVIVFIHSLMLHCVLEEEKEENNVTTVETVPPREVRDISKYHRVSRNR